MNTTARRKPDRPWIVEGTDGRTGAPINLTLPAVDGVQAWDGAEARGIVVKRVIPAYGRAPAWASRSLCVLMGLVRLPSTLLGAGLLLAMLPVLVPVWSIRWYEVPSVAARAGGTFPAGVVEKWGLAPRAKSMEQRGFLFESSHSVLEFIRAETVVVQSTRIGVAWLPERVTRQPQFGRMVAESAVIFVPFALAAWAAARHGGWRRVSPVALASGAASGGDSPRPPSWPS